MFVFFWQVLDGAKAGGVIFANKSLFTLIEACFFDTILWHCRQMAAFLRRSEYMQAKGYRKMKGEIGEIMSKSKRLLGILLSAIFLLTMSGVGVFAASDVDVTAQDPDTCRIIFI